MPQPAPAGSDGLGLTTAGPQSGTLAPLPSRSVADMVPNNSLGLLSAPRPCACNGLGCDQCDSDKSACPDKCDCVLFPPRLTWYARVEGAAIRRSPINSFDFASLDGPSEITLSTQSFDYDYRAAGRFLVGHTINDQFQIEAAYIGVREGADNRAVRDSTANDLGGTGNLFSPFGYFGYSPVTGLDRNSLAQIRYTSSLQSAEVNIRRQVPMPPQRLCFSILFGVRYADLPERFDYYTEANVPAPSGAKNWIQVNTANQMVGPQIGSLFEVYVDNRWWINFEAKGAIMANTARQSTFYRNVDENGLVTDYSHSQREVHTAFLGDVAATLVYRWTPNCSTRLGYQAIWLQDVALAAANFNTNIDIIRQGPAQLNHREATIYHGPFAGIEFGW